MVTAISHRTLLQLIDAGVQVVDVLPEKEFSGSHIPGAINIPLKALNAETVSLLSRDKPVVVY
jgi:rhodanese-related sulfurtransferase